MPSPPILDFDTLVAPIPGDDPAGSPVPFAVTEQLEEMRKEIDPDSFSKDDPTRPEAKKADWRGTIELAQETLRNTSKDMLIAARLTEALVKVHGFAGLRDGLHLLRLLAEQCWDRLLPAIEEEDDLEVRAARSTGWTTRTGGARFPGTLRLVPLMAPDRERYGWQHWKDSQGGKSKITAAEIERAIQVTPLEKRRAIVEDMERKLEGAGGPGPGPGREGWPRHPGTMPPASWGSAKPWAIAASWRSRSCRRRGGRQEGGPADGRPGAPGRGGIHRSRPRPAWRPGPRSMRPWPRPPRSSSRSSRTARSPTC